MATPPLRHDFVDEKTPLPGQLPAAEYNRNAVRTDAAYDAATAAVPKTSDGSKVYGTGGDGSQQPQNYNAAPFEWTLAQRRAGGRLKATAGTEDDDVVNVSQLDRRLYRFLAADIKPASAQYPTAEMPTTTLDGLDVEWSSSGNGTVGVFILDGQTFVYTAQGAALYVNQKLPTASAPWRWGRIRFQFADVGSTNAHTACLAATKQSIKTVGNGRMQMATHLTASKTSWAFGPYDTDLGASAFQIIESGSLNLGQGVPYDMGFEIQSASKCLVRLPDGNVRLFTDPQARFLDYGGSNLFGESYSPTLTDGTVLIKSVHGGTGRAPSDLFV